MAPRSIHGLANSSVSGKGAKARAVTASTGPRLSGGDRFDARRVNLSRRAGRARRFAEEGAFPAVALDAMDDCAGNVRKLDGDHEAGEAGAGAHVEPTFGVWRKREQLRGIRDVAGPDGREGRVGDEVGLAPPAVEQVDEDGEALLCFT